MKIGIRVPVKRGSIRGNEVTAERWQSLLRGLNHDVEISTSDEPVPNVELLIAIHAVRSHDSICQFRKQHPKNRLIVCLSGTDLHGVFDDQDSPNDERKLAIESLTHADVILLLEPNGMRKLPAHLKPKCRVIFQSAERVPTASQRDHQGFQASVIGHLRHQKAPMLAARASRLLPDDSKVKVVHVGEILENFYVGLVDQEVQQNSRYNWLGKLDHASTLQVLVSSDVTVLTSVQEGAPSIISEAVINEIPILATRIDATEGMLGDHYPGLFPIGDSQRLADLMLQAEQDPSFLQLLKKEVSQLKDRYTKEAEVAAWDELLRSFN